MGITKSILLSVDSYKLSQFCQYPPTTTGVYSYIESRGGQYKDVVFFGLQAFIKEYLTTPITQEDIDFAESIAIPHGEPFNREGWEYILKEHGGKLPVVIKAAKEGSVIPYKNVLVTVENTDPKCYWLTSYLETAMLRAVWYPSTVASRGYSVKQVIKGYLERTGTPELIDYKLHDFGSRGVNSFEGAAIGGAAHLVNFKGTDTISGLLFAREYYNAGIAGHSIPATEHSCITSWGRENEAQAYRNLIKQFGKPGSIFACVSDSYDIFNACENIWGEELKAEVVDSGATLVIRPDSGQPEEVCVKVIQILGEKFGYTVNNKGYKVLNNVRIIQGDGVTESMINCILGHFAVLGWSADNIAFGAGGYLLQQLDRDTNKWAMKCSSVRVLEECTVNRGDGYYDKGTEHVWKDVYKDPITDHGKKSKKGRVTLWTNPAGEFVSSVTPPTGWTDKGFYGEWTEALYEVYRDGNLTKEYTFEEVRTNTN